MRSLLSIETTNFRSLAKVKVQLSDLSVLVGPNGAGKTNLLQAIQFLGDTARLDLSPAISEHGGFDALAFRGERKLSPRIRIPRIRLEISAAVTKYSSENAPDEYSLSFWEQSFSRTRILRRIESFQFKRTKGRGRRIRINGGNVEIREDDETQHKLPLDISSTSAALSTLRRLGAQMSATQVDELATLFETFRVYEPQVRLARRPAGVVENPHLNADASNLPSFLYWMFREHKEIFHAIEEDLCFVCPSIKSMRFKKVGGGAEAVAIQFVESGLSGFTNLSDASFGTVRALAILAMLHDPNPPKLTCVEEIDHGLHPHALDRIVDRLRDASDRTQVLVATHSPALVNRLDPSELIVCERDHETGASRIPAINPEELAEVADATELRLGELWFSGVLGGGL